MTNEFTVLNIGVGGSVMDETGIVYSGALYEDRRRARVVIAGDDIDKLADIRNIGVTGNEYAMTTRNIPAWYQTLTYSYGNANISKNDAETEVLNYTVPSGQTFFFTGLNCSADTVGVFRSYIDGNQFTQLRNNITNLNATMNSAIPLVSASANSVFSVKAENLSTLSSDTFEVSIFGFTLPTG